MCIRDSSKTIVSHDNDKERGAAFFIGSAFLDSLKEYEGGALLLSNFFNTLFHSKVSNLLINDLCESALKIYTNPHEQVVLSAALRTAEYIAGGKEAVYLEQLSPDMAIAVKAIVEEGNL